MSAHAPTSTVHTEPAAPVVAAAEHTTPEVHTTAETPVSETRVSTAKAAHEVIEEEHEAPHSEAAPHAAPHTAAHPAAAAHPAHEEGAPLLPKWEGDGVKKVAWDAVKGTLTIGTLPITVPYVAGRLVVGSLYAAGGRIYDGGAWVGRKAKNFWKKDTFYIPTATKAVGSVIAWPFRKLWQGTKWTGRKIKGVFVRPEEPEVTLPTHETPPATPPAAATPAPEAASAHSHPTPAADAAHATPTTPAPALPAPAHATPALPAPATATPPALPAPAAHH